jgi:hypothetical protein
MANSLYPNFKKAILQKEHNLIADILKATLIDSADYTYSASHSTYADATVPAIAKVAVSPQLTSPNCTSGILDTDNFIWSAVTGDVSEAVILWNDTPTTPTADPLIAFFNEGLVGMPITPNGGNIYVTVHVSGWFTL